MRMVFSCSMVVVLLCAAVVRGQDDALAEDVGQPPGENAEPPEGANASWLSGWKGSVSAGTNGSAGNTETFNARLGLDAQRATESLDTRLSLSYTFGKAEGRTSDNYFQTTARNDWLLRDSRWRPFVRGAAEFDEFQDWDWRLTGIAGMGYELARSDDVLLIGRLGAGGRYDIGGADDGLVPEGALGLDYEHQLTERQKFVATVDYLPSLDDYPAYRVEGKASWEIVVDPEVKLSLRIGIENRYDSTPGLGFKRNDLDYFAMLSWAF